MNLRLSIYPRDVVVKFFSANKTKKNLLQSQAEVNFKGDLDSKIIKQCIIDNVKYIEFRYNSSSLDSSYNSPILA